MEKFDLFLFLKSIQDLSEEHISSLQAFESSLLMAMHDRWIASVISITNGIETLLRIRYGRSEELSRMIDLAVADGLVSSSLGERGHEIRKLRNKFIHNMVSPKDNPTAAHAYIMKSIPLYRKLVSSLLNGTDIFDVIENDKIKLIYEHTRKAITRSTVKNKEHALNTNCLTVFKKSIVNTTISSIAPIWYSEKISAWEEDHWNGFIPNDYEDLVERYRGLCTSPDSDFFHLGHELICPAHPCTGHLVIEISETAELISSPIDIVHSAACPLCDLKIDDKLQLLTFVEPQLPIGWIEEEIISIRGKKVSDTKLIRQSLENMLFRFRFGTLDKSARNWNVPEIIEHLEELPNLVKNRRHWDGMQWFNV